MDTSIRLDKYLASLGIASRRNIANFLLRKTVTVNGEKVREPGIRINPNKDIILINNQKLYKPNLVYFMLNKPKDVISTASDESGRPTVLSLVKTKERIFPVGRLDQDSTGLILLTNDGELANHLTHPRYHIPKTYHVTVTGSVTDYKLERFRTGIDLEDGRTLPAEVKLLKKLTTKTVLAFTLHEGKKRQIRRMCSVLRLHVLDLKRVQMGPLKLGDLKSGEYRSLTADEIQRLKNYSLTD